MTSPSKATKRVIVDEDFDDLDDVLDDFSGGSSLTTAAASIPPAPTKSAPALPVAGDVDDEFPDPDDELLEGEDFSKLVSEGMAGIMNGLGPDEEAEFKTLMAEMMKGGGAEEGDFDPASFLAALGGDSSMFGGDAAGPSKVTSASKGKSKAKASSKPAPAVNFQDTIASAMNKLKDSSTTLDAESEAKATAGGDPLAAMMAQMAGLGDMGGEEGLQGMLDEVMDQLMSRELLYEPLKELSDKYPAYLAENAAALSATDRTRYEEQQAIVLSIVAKFEEPGAEITSGGTAAEEATRKERSTAVVFLVGKMNDCGAPPAEIMGAMPEGMELGPNGVPKLPGDCAIA